MKKVCGGGVEVVSCTEEDTPYCPHGPTIKFERFFASDKHHCSSTQFFACAVYRSRKECPFYHPVLNTLSNDKYQHYIEIYRDYQRSLLAECVPEANKILIGLNKEDRCLCDSCGILLPNKEIMAAHNEHNIRYGIEDRELVSPTTLLRPQDNDKGQAQYFFSSETQSLLVSEIDRMGKTLVICLGVPRLHEELFRQGKVNSFLLDIDHRFIQFYPSKVFQRYNMFNGFFYSEDGLKYLKEFIGSSPSKNVILVVDPPFGGLLTALKTGISQIWNTVGKEELDTLLVFPYFNEHHVLESFPSFHMSDYQVNYEGHPHFNNKRPNRPSPVRIYTNLPLPGLKLPHNKGYRLCSVCNRYVHENNIHCSKCGYCPSKDGRPYNHCDICHICVKQSFVHCSNCGVCLLPKHDCNNKASSVGCHICGDFDHKRRSCPLKNTTSDDSKLTRKRPSSSSGRGKGSSSGRGLKRMKLKK